MNSSLNMADQMATKKMISSVPFCPIENGNYIKLTVRINGITSTSGKPVPKGDKSQKTLSDLIGARLTIVLGKEDTLMGMMDKSSSANPFHWMVAMGNSMAM